MPEKIVELKDLPLAATPNVAIATPDVAPSMAACFEEKHHHVLSADVEVKCLHAQGEDDMTKKEETKWRDEWSEVLHRIPNAEIESITIKAVRDYWQVPITQKKGSIGTCPNCRRNDMVIKWSGLCSSCDKNSQNLTGYALLVALGDTRKRMAARVGLRFRRRVPQPPAVQAVMGNEVVAADYRESPIYRLGLHYKEIGEKLMDPATSINDLVAAAGQLGLRIDFNLERRP